MLLSFPLNIVYKGNGLLHCYAVVQLLNVTTMTSDERWQTVARHNDIDIEAVEKSIACAKKEMV